MASPLLLIDSYSQIYRGYYAIRGLSTAQGTPTNAVFAMTKLLLRLRDEYPGYDGAFVFDKGRPAQRMLLAPSYKANRPPMPEDLRAQLDPIREMIRAFGWNIVEWDGSEADDLIAAAAERFHDRKVLIVSSDKDISQVIDERVEMLVPDHDSKGFHKRGVAETVAKFGVKPEGIVDYLALIGDSSDNIPGVEGVGPKTAAALLNQFGSIDNLIAHARGYHIIKGLSKAPVSSAHALRHCQPANPFDKFDRIFSDLDDWKVNEFFFHAIRTGEIVLPYMDAETVPEVKDSVDYWAVNYYCRNLISARKKTADSVWYTATHQKMIDMNFYLEEFFPEGLLCGLLRLKDKPVYITENGVACDDDRWRIVKLAQDLAALSDAVKQGVDVRGYLHWSTMDNYEWYTFKPRFGLVSVDFKTFERTPKPSASFYREIIERNGFDGSLVRKYLPDVPPFRLY